MQVIQKVQSARYQLRAEAVHNAWRARWPTKSDVTDIGGKFAAVGTQFHGGMKIVAMFYGGIAVWLWNMK